MVATLVAARANAEQRYYTVASQTGDFRYPYGHSRPRIVCQPLHVCDIKLAEHESILNIAVGDAVRWIVASAQSGPGGTTPHVFLKPTDYDLRTNLVITTTRHDYYIDLTSSRTDGPSRISFYYPDEENRAKAVAAVAANVAEAEATPSPAPTPTPAEVIDFNYTVTGNPSIAPRTVYNDGSHTYLLYDKLPNDLPVPYALSSDGAQQIINYRISGNTFVLDGLPSGVDLVLNAGTGRGGRGEIRAHIRRS